MPITGKGWEILVNRLGEQRAGAKMRTYGTYQVYIDGQPVADLDGFICETVGPGDNSTEDNGKRIEQGRYPLATQFGRYRTIGYSTNTTTAGDAPMPAICLENTGQRSGILIHPAHPPNLYLSSIGCLNPTGPRQTAQDIGFWDSRARVIAFIQSLQHFAPAAFQHQTATPIANAWAVIDGEPVNLLPDSVPLVAQANSLSSNI